MNSWSVPPAATPLVFSSSSFPPTPSVPTPVAGVTQFPTQWEHPHDLGVLKKHLTVLGEDMKPVLRILTENARSLEDYINNAYLSSVSGGVVYGPVSLESGTTFNGGAVFNSSLNSGSITAAGTITATYFSGSGISLTSIPNSATTATSANTASAIVARDSSGNITVTQVLGQLAGNATTATTAANVPYSGLTGTVPTWNQNTTGSSGSTTGSSTSCSGNAATASDSSLLNGYSSATAATGNTIARRGTSGELIAWDYSAGSSNGQFYSTTAFTYIGQDCARVTNATNVYAQLVAGRAMYVSVNGTLGNLTSSRRYKENIAKYHDESNKLLNVTAATFDYKMGLLPEGEEEERYNQFGLIAEDLHDAGLAHLVYYNADGQPDSVDYPKIAVELLGVVKNLEARIRLLEARS